MGIVGLACLLLLAADPVGPLAVTPGFSRCVVDPQGTRTLALVLTSTRPCTLITATTECRCVHVLTRCPQAIVPGAPLTIVVQVAGVLPGVKTVSLRTTIGLVTATVQVVSSGLGLGRDLLQHALLSAQRDHAAVIVLLTDLKGAIRNCGCSDGSLGGLDHLAALPQWAQAQVPATALRFLYAGDTNGMRLGVDSLLSSHGWSPAGHAVVLSDHPEDAVLDPGTIAVVPTVPTALNHAKIVRLPLDDGMVIAVLTLSGTRLVHQDLIPVDQSLPRDGAILAGFTTPLSVHVHDDVQPSDACIACHRGAGDTWHASAHAHAYAALAVADRTDACIACHSTRISPTTTDVAAGVHCQACHLSTQEHVVSRGSIRTAGTVSCRSCHDERRQPDFLRDPAWARILHGR